MQAASAASAATGATGATGASGACALVVPVVCFLFFFRPLQACEHATDVTDGCLMKLRGRLPSPRFFELFPVTDSQDLHLIFINLHEAFWQSFVSRCHLSHQMP